MLKTIDAMAEMLREQNRALEEEMELRDARDLAIADTMRDDSMKFKAKLAIMIANNQKAIAMLEGESNG